MFSIYTSSELNLLHFDYMMNNSSNWTKQFLDLAKLLLVMMGIQLKTTLNLVEKLLCIFYIIF